MKTTEWPFPSLNPHLIHGTRRHQIRLTGRHSTEEMSIKFTPYPRTHARSGFADDHIMRTVDERFKDSAESLPLAFAPELATVLEEDEVALNLYNTLRVGEDCGRDQRNILRIDLKLVVVDLAFIVRRQLRKLRYARND